MNKKTNAKTFLRNFGKKCFILFLSAFLIFSSVFLSFPFPVRAESLWNKVDNWMDAVRTDNALEWLDFNAKSALRDGGNFKYDLTKYPMLRSALNARLDYYSNPTETGTREHGGGGKSFSYQKNTGVSTPQNTTNYNTTNKTSIYKETKTWNTTTNNYDYTYNWYNPITNTYNTTNNYTYNTTYNTYHYTTNNYDIDFNYDIDYTTNYYIQDNRTYISYYIIETNNKTQEEEETYLELYYQLSDGRNSLYLTVDDIKGQYFPSNYSKYISVAEDDGTTLGLWHLDGDLKDSSYWGNTAGSAYNNVYTDGLYLNGKKFSDSEDDFLELKLDKVNLPNSWTLEWCEFVPESVGVSPESVSMAHAEHSSGCSSDKIARHDVYNRDYHFYYYDNEQYDIDLGTFAFNGLFSFGETGGFYKPISGYFVPYSLIFDGTNYFFYANGNLVDTYDFSNKTIETVISRSVDYYDFNNVSLSCSSVSVTSDSIIFSTASERVRDSTGYVCTSSQYDTYDGSYRPFHLRMCHPVYNIVSNPHKNAIIDEVRLSSGVLFSGNSYTPSSQPYTTNTVLAVPENPEKHEIAFKTNIEISDVRFGGARPTYPTNGFVYVSIDDEHKVESIQQYQENGWYEIEASIYLDDGWEVFKGFDMNYLTIGGVDDDSGGDDSGGDDSGSGDDNGNQGDNSGDGGDSGDSGGGISAIIEGIGKFFDTILNLIGKVIGLISDFVNSVFGLFDTLTVFTKGFSAFLSSAFGFLPPEAVSVIVSGITLIVILAIIKFLK